MRWRLTYVVMVAEFMMKHRSLHVWGMARMSCQIFAQQLIGMGEQVFSVQMCSIRW